MDALATGQLETFIQTLDNSPQALLGLFVSVAWAKHHGHSLLSYVCEISTERNSSNLGQSFALGFTYSPFLHPA